jgi:hypothetical protein
MADTDSSRVRSARYIQTSRDTSDDIQRDAEKPMTLRGMFQGPSYDKDYENRSFMRNLGRQIPRENADAARDAADTEDARIQQRKTATRTPTKRTPPRTAGRK